MILKLRLRLSICQNLGVQIHVVAHTRVCLAPASKSAAALAPASDYVAATVPVPDSVTAPACTPAPTSGCTSICTKKILAESEDQQKEDYWYEDNYYEKDNYWYEDAFYEKDNNNYENEFDEKKDYLFYDEFEDVCWCMPSVLLDFLPVSCLRFSIKLKLS